MIVFVIKVIVYPMIIIAIAGLQRFSGNAQCCCNGVKYIGRRGAQSMLDL